MSDKQKIFGVANITLLASGAFCATLGLVVMTGWHTDHVNLVRFIPNSIGMAYNTALLFLLCGIGMIGVVAGKPLVTRICATLISFTCLVVLIEYVFDVKLGIDELFVRADLTRPLNNPHPGRMSIISTVAFLFTTAAMFLISSARNFEKKSCCVGALGSLVFSSGISVFIGYLFTSLSALGWGPLTKMAVNSATGFLILGAAFIVYAWLADRCAGYDAPCWSPILVCVFVVMTSYGLSQALANKDDIHVNQTTALEQENLKSQIGGQLEYRVSTLLRMAKHIGDEEHTSKREWQADIEFYIGHVTGYRGMMWIDVDPHSRLSHFTSGKISLSSSDLQFAPALTYGGENSQTTIARKDDHSDEAEGFITHVPVYRDGKLAGIILCEFDTAGFMESVLSPEVQRDYSFILYDGDTPIYDQSGGLPPDNKFTIPDSKIESYGVKWEIRVWPKPGTIAAEQSYLDEATAGAGLLLALLLSWVIYLLQTAKMRQRETEAQSSQRLRAEAKLHETENRYRNLVELGQGLVCTHTLDGTLLTVNPASARLLEYLPEELIGKNIEFITAPPFKRYLKHYHNAIAEKREAVGLWYLTTKSGKTVIWRYHNVLLEDEGKVTYVLGNANDVTEIKRAEEEIRAGKELLLSFVEHTPAAVAMLDTNLCYLMTSKRWLTDYRIDRDSIIGESHYDIFPNISSELIEVYKRCLAGASESRDEDLYVRPDGSTEWLRWEVHPWHKSEKEIGGIIISTVFITARKQAELERERLSSILEATSDLVGIAGMDGKIAYSNRACRRLLGIGENEDITNTYIADYVTDASLRLVTEEAIPTAIRDGIWNGETIIKSRDGREIPVSQVIIAHKNINGEVDFTGTVMRDISEAKIVAWELKTAKEAAEAANQAKSDFLANMSHEIRTPINGIMGMTELALDTDLTDEQRGYLQLVKASSDSLMTVINDILDFSKIEARKLEIEPIAFSLSESLDKTMKELSVRSHQRGLELICEIDPQVPDALIGDPGRIRQVIVNLVGNAIKFTGDGEIVVHVDANCPGNEKAGNSCLLHFKVIDTGVGIPREKHATIFNAFTQADTSTTRKYGGTGLGLTISSQLVSLMGGRMWVDSAPDKGSVFHFIVALKKQAKSSQPAVSPEARCLRDMPVLVLASNKTTARVVSEMLSNWHMKPTSAHSGEEALSVMQQMVAQNGSLPMIILDSNMPELGAFAAANYIKSHQRQGHPGIVMLAYSNQSGNSGGNIGHYHNLTAASQVAKPVMRSDLLAAILKALGKEPEKTPVGLSASQIVIPTQHRRFNVLLAEDNIVNQALAIRLLEKQRHTVTVANNGREALTAFSKNIFDLVLMDVQMPELDGFKTTGIIREKERGTGRRIPIIAMTAHAMKGDRERCLAEGMDDYVSKPIKADALYSIIEKLITRPDDENPNEATPSEEKREYSEVYNFADNEIECQFPSEPAFDKVQALERVDGDLELMADMIDLFMDDYVNQISDIDKAISESNPKVLERAAHKLKGAAGNFVAKSVCDLAHQLETMGRAGDLGKASVIYETLKTQIGKLTAELTKVKEQSLSTDQPENLNVPRNPDTARTHNPSQSTNIR